MANKKNYYYYVLVIQNYGPVFVTGVQPKHVAEWDRLKKPMEMSREYARDMAIGLTWNGYLAYVVCQPYELNCQPYRYEDGKLEFKGNDKEGGDEE